MDLIGKIDEAMLRDRLERPTYTRSNHTANDISACIRQLYYRWTEPERGTDQDQDVNRLWTFGLGDAVERIVVEALSQARVYHVASEWATFEHSTLRYPVRYKIDFEFLDDDGELAVCDVKSGYGRAIAEQRRDGRPKQSAVEQLAFYLGARRRNRGYLLFAGRDSAYRAQDRFDVEDGQLIGMRWDGSERWATGVSFRAQLEKLAELEGYIDNEVVPDRPYRAAIKNGELRREFQMDSVVYKGDWQCTYCPFAKHCWSDELVRLAQGNNAAILDAKAVKK